MKDAVDMTLWFADHPEANGIFNVGSGEANDWNRLITAIFTALGREPDIEYIPMPDHLKGKYQYHTEATHDQARAPPATTGRRPCWRTPWPTTCTNHLVPDRHLGREGPGLFPLPSAELLDGLAALPRALSRAFPLKAKHRAALPGGIRKLSDFLTVDRENLPRDYMTRPEYLAAYLHYFLPWNIYRQGRLLTGLDLALKPGARVVDLGAGPLTFLLALWLARPACGNRNWTTWRWTAPSPRSRPAASCSRRWPENRAGPSAPTTSRRARRNSSRPICW